MKTVIYNMQEMTVVYESPTSNAKILHWKEWDQYLALADDGICIEASILDDCLTALNLSRSNLNQI